MNFNFTKSTTYVDETGTPVSVETVTSGLAAGNAMRDVSFEEERNIAQKKPQRSWQTEEL
jgi:hypothetical protein